jgi:hypothetical protein
VTKTITAGDPKVAVDHRTTTRTITDVAGVPAAVLRPWTRKNRERSPVWEVGPVTAVAAVATMMKKRIVGEGAAIAAAEARAPKTIGMKIVEAEDGPGGALPPWTPKSRGRSLAAEVVPVTGDAVRGTIMTRTTAAAGRRVLHDPTKLRTITALGDRPDKTTTMTDRIVE